MSFRTHSTHDYDRQTNPAGSGTNSCLALLTGVANAWRLHIAYALLVEPRRDVIRAMDLCATQSCQYPACRLFPNNDSAQVLRR
jgi:hypothetical protein